MSSRTLSQLFRIESLETRRLLSGLPLSPTNVSAAAVNGNTVNVNWVDNSSNENGFRVDRSSDFSNFTTLGNVGANVTAFTDNTATPSTQFIYRLTAFNGVGDSLSHNAPAIVTPSIPELAPAAPSNLRFNLNGTSATLMWNDNSSNETKFIVEQLGGFFQTFFRIAETPANQQSVTLAVGNDQPLQFRVKAFNPQGGDSTLSNTISVLAAPATPTNLNSVGLSTSCLVLNWQAYGSPTFTVQRLIGSVWTTIATTMDRSLVVGSLPFNSTHQFRVIASNATGPSNPTAPIVGSTTMPRVTGLRATSVTANSVSLAWDDVANERSFKIERSSDGASFTTVGFVVANQTNFTDTNLPAGTTFTYRVSAFMFFEGAAPASNPITVSTLGGKNANRMRITMDDEGLNLLA